MNLEDRSGTRSTPSRACGAARNVGLVVLLATAVLTGCGEDEGDLASFCEAVEDLQNDDPFAELAAGVDRIAAAAPQEIGSQADRYADAVESLRDELAGAGYDPTRVDQLRYGQAVASYTEAATSVSNAADADCGDPG